MRGSGVNHDEKKDGSLWLHQCWISPLVLQSSLTTIGQSYQLNSTKVRTQLWYKAIGKQLMEKHQVKGGQFNTKTVMSCVFALSKHTFMLIKWIIERKTNRRGKAPREREAQNVCFNCQVWIPSPPVYTAASVSPKQEHAVCVFHKAASGQLSYKILTFL